MIEEEENYLNDVLDDERNEITRKQTENRKKPVVTTQKSIESVKFSDNNHIADLQQRVIRLEYELLFMKDKLFEPSRTANQPKISPYGKIVKRRISQNG